MFTNSKKMDMANSTSMEDRQMDLAEREQYLKWQEEQRKRQAKYAAINNLANSAPATFSAQASVPSVNLYSNGGDRVGGSMFRQALLD